MAKSAHVRGPLPPYTPNFHDVSAFVISGFPLPLYTFETDVCHSLQQKYFQKTNRKVLYPPSWALCHTICTTPSRLPATCCGCLSLGSVLYHFFPSSSWVSFLRPYPSILLKCIDAPCLVLGPTPSTPLRCCSFSLSFSNITTLAPVIN